MRNIIIKLFLITLVVSNLVSCDLFGVNYHPKEELQVISGIDGSRYIYSEKVIVQLSYDGLDALQLRNTNNDNWESVADTVLKANFSEFAWNEFVLFIHVNDKYYTFDIDDYHVNEDVSKNEKYDIREYDENQFKEKFVDYENYDWCTH